MTIDIDQLRCDFQQAFFGHSEDGEPSLPAPLVIKYDGGEMRDDFPRPPDPQSAKAVYALTVPLYMSRCPEGVRRQEWLLLIIKAMGKHFTGGPRDEAFEQDIFSALFRIQGMAGMARLFQVELPPGL